MKQETIIKHFLNDGLIIGLKNEDIESELEIIITKLENKEAISDKEKNFLTKYMKNYYPKKVDLYPYPQYDKYLKQVHKRLAKYYMSNINENNGASVTYLQFYFLTDMCKDFNIKPQIYIGNPYDKDCFKNDSDAKALHFNVYIKGIEKSVPVICYNPMSIEQATEKGDILSLINYGFHELRHEVQKMQIMDEKLYDAQALLWAKEHVLRSVVGDVFYEENYKDIFHERDARDYALERTKAVLSEYGSSRQKYQVNKFIWTEAPYDLNVSFIDVELGDKKKAIDLLDIVASKYIKTYPNYLEKFSVLKNIYSENGDKKTLIQIEYELNEKKKEEIKKNPGKKKEISKKYAKLEDDIIQTDSDLLIQALCQEAAILKDISKEEFLQKVEKINEVAKRINYSYEETMYRINNRINLLSKEKKFKELEEMESLKKSMIEYIDSFKNEFNIKRIQDDNIRKIQGVIGESISRYDYVLDNNGGLIQKSKSLKELKKDFSINSEKVKVNSSSQEEYSKNIATLRAIYSIFERDLTSEPFYEVRELLEFKQETEKKDKSNEINSMLKEFESKNNEANTNYRNIVK